MDEFPSTYAVAYVRGVKCYVDAIYFSDLREGMRGGNPAVDVVDVDGEKCVINCQKVDILFLSTEESRAKSDKFDKEINEEDGKKEPWEE